MNRNCIVLLVKLALQGSFSKTWTFMQISRDNLHEKAKDNLHRIQWRSQPDSLVMLCKFKSLSLFISLEIDSLYGL